MLYCVIDWDGESPELPRSAFKEVLTSVLLFEVVLFGRLGRKSCGTSIWLEDRLDVELVPEENRDGVGDGVVGVEVLEVNIVMPAKPATLVPAASALLPTGAGDRDSFDFSCSWY